MTFGGFLFPMKFCSKCQQELPETEFVKSDRYLDGLYPYCKACRKAKRQEWLSKNPLCSKCGVEPHAKSHSYCKKCLNHSVAVSKPTRTSEYVQTLRLCYRCRVRPRDKGVWLCVECQGICPKCKRNPVAPSSVWCRVCLNEYLKAKRIKVKGTWYRNLSDLQKQKLNARKKLHLFVKLGKLQRLPCEICGKLETEGHHHNGYSIEHALDVRWLCSEHHWALMRWEKMKQMVDTVSASDVKADQP